MQLKLVPGVAVMVVAGCKLSATGSLTGGSSTIPRTAGPESATGDDMIIVPDVFLKTRADAEAALARAGYQREASLDTSICGSVVDKTVIELGRVCSQSPPAGARTSPRTPIYLRVQSENPWHGELGGGRSWFLMPDLTGVSLGQATAKIKALGFTSKEVQVAYVEERSCAPNTVCRTYPEGLTRTDNTSDKVFYVGRSPEPARPADPKPATATTDSKQPAPKPATTDSKPPAPPKPASVGDLF